MYDDSANTEINSRRIAHVENCFGISGVPLNVAGRVLVGEGILTKICRKKPKPRQFFLFNDILVYGTIIINRKKYTNQHVIPLEGLVLEDLPDDVAQNDQTNGWLLKTPTKSFAVFAGSATEKAEWMGHIRKCVNDLLKHSGKTQINCHAAVWVPDSGARVCMHCKTTQFTLINRRHHCRCCGAVICGNCSKNRVVLLHQSDKPVRVCDACFSQKTDHLNRFRQNRSSSHSESLHEQLSACILNEPQTEQTEITERPKSILKEDSVVDQSVEDQTEQIIETKAEADNSITEQNGNGYKLEDFTSDSEDENENEPTPICTETPETVPADISQTTFYDKIELSSDASHERAIDVLEEPEQTEQMIDEPQKSDLLPVELNQEKESEIVEKSIDKEEVPDHLKAIPVLITKEPETKEMPPNKVDSTKTTANTDNVNESDEEVDCIVDPQFDEMYGLKK